MSKENLEQFMSKVAVSEELNAKIGEEIDAEALIALGAECGCEFTAEELQDSAELSHEELGTIIWHQEGPHLWVTERREKFRWPRPMNDVVNTIYSIDFGRPIDGFLTDYPRIPLGGFWIEKHMQMIKLRGVCKHR